MLIEYVSCRDDRVTDKRACIKRMNIEKKEYAKCTKKKMDKQMNLCIPYLGESVQKPFSKKLSIWFSKFKGYFFTAYQFLN